MLTLQLDISWSCSDAETLYVIDEGAKRKLDKVNWNEKETCQKDKKTEKQDNENYDQLDEKEKQIRDCN